MEILQELDNKLSEDDINNITEEVVEDGSGTLDFDGGNSFSCSNKTMSTKC